MHLARKLLALVVPATLAAGALLHARAIGALVEASAAAAPLPSPPVASPVAQAPMNERPEADALRVQRAFDHAAAPPPAAPLDCTGVRALVAVRGERPEGSVAALDVGGRRLLRARGGDAGDMQIAWIGADRVWLARGGDVCEARVFSPARAPAPAPVGAPRGIVRVSEHEVHIDRGLLERTLDAPGDLAGVRAIPDADGVRLAKVPKDGVVALLGLRDGDRVVSAGGIAMNRPENLLALYGRLRSIERLSIVVVRGGKPITVDYVVR